ncbi:MAG: histidine phosphatase family protein [Lachnospiraceae bacterium]|nr:histidine phosphatase family protein [Lachnospiraceae bacterium]
MLYIIRHGTTEWNKRHKLQGRTDVPLCKEGRQMAELAAKEYAQVHFDICFCSPLIRAKETAQILLAGRQVPVFYDDRLMEMCFGKYEGIENSFQIPDCPVNAFFKDPAHYSPEPDGGESMEELFERTGAFLEERVYPALDRGEDVLIVGHGAMNSSIVSRIKGLSRADFWREGIENCKLMRLL